MPATNTPTHFGWVTKCFHWLTALLILTAIVLGVLAHDAAFDTSQQLARKAWLFSFHKTVGIAAFFVAVMRVIWALTQPRPGKISGKSWEHRLAEVAHWALYFSMILVPLAGWVTHAASSGYAPIWWPFGQSLPLVPKSPDLSVIAGQIHMAWEKILIIAILLHVAGALKHHLIDKDATLRRMLVGSPDVQVTPNHKSLIGPGVAVGAFIVVAAIGWARADVAAPNSQNALAQPAASGWTVENGTVAITVMQFGNAVDGQFADWTAAIEFDPDVAAGAAGSVEGQIAIGSLTLGSVTGQAMGPDYFAADQFPTANYNGNIIAVQDGHVLIGNVTLRGTTRPFEMPFTLTVDGQTADAEGQFSLARLDFGIGTNQQDGGQLGFDVLVNVALTATRSD